MSNDLGDILAQRHIPQEPPEFPVIRAFLRDKLDATANLQIMNSTIVIGVEGSALAGTLRFHLEELKSLLETDKNLVILSM